jgi:hypothetical protein
VFVFDSDSEEHITSGDWFWIYIWFVKVVEIQKGFWKP